MLYNIKYKMKNRLPSLDLLKILAIFLIVVFHASYKGIPTFVVDSLGWVNQAFYYIFYHFGELGVNLFMLITGFFLVSSTSVKKNKIIKIILDVYFFAIFSVVLSLVFKKYVFHIQDLFPITFTYYWYVTGYLIIYILSPFINKFVRGLSQKQFQKLLFILFILFSFIPTVAGLTTGSTEDLGFYNRFVWLLFVYLAGGYLSVYRGQLSLMNSSVKKLLIALYKLLLFVGAFAIFSYFAQINTRFFNIPPNYFWGPNSVVIFLISILLFALFYHFKIPENKFTALIAQSTLSIYLLHEHPKFLFILWLDIFSFAPFYYSKKLFLMVIIYSLVVMLTGVLIHYFKKYTFDRLTGYFLFKCNEAKK